MQASLLLLLVLPAVFAVPCTDPTGAPPVTSPSPPPTNAPTDATDVPTDGPTDAPTDAPTQEPLPPAPKSFPTGTYGLPAPDTGCPPATGFKNWMRYQDTEDYYNGNQWNSTEHFKGFFKRDGFQQNFCVKPKATSNKVDYEWPAGDYCIVKKKACPTGFSEGMLRWDDENNFNQNGKTKNAKNAPDGTFDDNTEMYFCCRSDGSAPVRLPTKKPFYLYRYQGPCQQVYEMDVVEEVVTWDDEDTGNTNSATGATPFDSGNSANHRLHFCYYSPQPAALASE